MTRRWIERRLARLRGDERGMGLVFVLLIGTLIMIMLGTSATALVAQIRPTGVSVDDGAAIAAAEAGIEDFIAKVNANCPPTGGFTCPWLTTNLSSNSLVTDPTSKQGTLITGADGAGNRQSFVWKVTYTSPGVARVKSVGQVPLLGSPGKFRTKTLVADVQATPSFNNFEYYTKYETFPADFINSFYDQRSIAITSAANAAGSSLSGPGILSWNGTCEQTKTPSCDPNHGTDVCEDLFYPSANGPGRGTDGAWNNPVRRPAPSKQSAMGTDNSFAYYSENGTFTPTSGSPVGVTHDDTCDSSFEPNMVMNGPVYSQDAYLIDRGLDTGNSCNSMPNFNGYAYSMWNGVINGVQQPPNVYTQGYERVYPGTNGKLCTAFSPQPVYTTNELNLPANADGAQALATCTYTGPTRIQVQGSYAYITSPMTPTSPAPSGPAYCYISTGGFTNANAPAGAGVVDAQVPLSTTLIYVKNPTNATPALATAASPIFNLSKTTPMPSPTGSNSLTGTWTDDTTYSASQACPANDPTKRRNFDCETSPTAPAVDMASAISAAVNSTMQTGAASTTAMQLNLTNAIKAQFKPASLVQPARFDTSSGYYYTITVGLPTSTSTTTAAPPLSPADQFYQQASTGGFTTTTMAAAITIARVTCTSTNSSGCNNTKSTPIYSGVATGSISTGSAATTTASWPWFGAQSGGTTYTDPNNDITPYYNGFGDVYMDARQSNGGLHGRLAVVAEHDIVVTNNITYSNTDLNSTTDGLALIANHNVRIYRPLTCTDDAPAGSTTPGYCPNDLTGVYNTTLAWPLPNNYPSLKYRVDNAPAMFSASRTTGTIYATIFTLRGAFMADNFYRGCWDNSSNGGSCGSQVNIYGGLYQYHRGPTSLPYQNRPYQGSGTKMPGVVVNYTYDNMRSGQTANGGLRVPWIPNPPNRPAGSARTWNVVTIATGS